MPSNHRKLDPRVIRTRKLLRQALIELVPEKGFADLTIQDITDQATLNRATFYLHYTDKNDLLLDVFEELVTEGISNPLNQIENITPDEMTPIIAVFNHIAEYARFYRTILGEQGVPLFMSKVRQYIEETVLKWLEKFRPGILEQQRTIDMEIFSNYMGAAYLGVITWWLENDMPYTAEEMAGQLFLLTRQGVSSLAALK